MSTPTDYSYKRKYPRISLKSSLILHPPTDPATLIYVIPSFLTQQEATSLLTSVTAFHTLELSSHAQSRSVAFRDNDRAALSCSELSSLIWNSGLATLFETNSEFNTVLGKGFKAVGLNDCWRLYRYRTGQRFGPHYDDEAKGEDGLRGGFTLLIYLSGEDVTNDQINGKKKTTNTKDKQKGDNKKLQPTDADEPLEGGETIFYRGTIKNKKQVVSVKPVMGMALLHAQGGRCLLHEGGVVRKGVKWVLRSDVMYKAE